MQEKIRNPYFNKAHSNSAHLGQLIHHFETMIDWLGKQLGEELVVEDLEAAAAGDLADGGWVETVLIVTVAALHKNTAVADTFSVNFPTDIVKMNTFKEKKQRVLLLHCLQHTLHQQFFSSFNSCGHTSSGSFQALSACIMPFKRQ